MWSNLPSQLRTVLGTALALGLAVTGAAFALSFFALRAAAANPELQFGRGHEWLFPLAVDAALLFAEVLLLGASMVRGANRAVPVLLVAAFGVGTLYFNVTRVPPEVRPIAAAVPVASLLCTLGLAYLFKLLGSVSGSVQAYAPPPAAYGMLGPPGSPVQGAIWRQDASPYPAVGPWDHPGSLPTSTNGHTGHELNGSETDTATKRALVDLYLSGLPPAELEKTTASSIVAALGERGVVVSIREASRQWDAFKASNQSKQRRGR